MNDVIETYWQEATQNLKTKGECLEHYASREPTGFLQLDGFDGVPQYDTTRPDEDGDCLYAIGTTELMTGAPAVRILIGTTNHAAAIQLLKKLTAWFERHPELLHCKPVAKPDMDDWPF
jgi:hypothetical protein